MLPRGCERAREAAIDRIGCARVETEGLALEPFAHLCPLNTIRSRTSPSVSTTAMRSFMRSFVFRSALTHVRSLSAWTTAMRSFAFRSASTDVRSPHFVDRHPYCSLISLIPYGTAHRARSVHTSHLFDRAHSRPRHSRGTDVLGSFLRK